MNDQDLEDILTQYNTILQDKIQLGRYQKKQLIFISFNKFIIGIQYAIIILQLPIQYTLTQSSTHILKLVFYLYCGQYIAQLYLFCLSKKTKFIFTTCQILSFFLQYAISINHSPNTLYYLFFLLATCLELETVSLNALLKDIIPNHEFNNKLWIVLYIEGFGTLFYLIMGFIYMESLDQGDWRDQIQSYLYLCTVAICASILNLEDSPKTLLKRQKFTLAYRKLDFIGKQNNNDYQILDNDEKDRLAQWSNAYVHFNSFNKYFFTIFNNQYHEQTIVLGIVSMINESFKTIAILYSLFNLIVFQSYILLFLAYLIQTITLFFISFIDKYFTYEECLSQNSMIYLIIMNIFGQAYIKGYIYLCLMAFATIFIIQPFQQLYFQTFVKSTYKRSIKNKALRWMYLTQKIGGLVIAHYFLEYFFEHPIAILGLGFYASLINIFIFIYLAAISHQN